MHKEMKVQEEMLGYTSQRNHKKDNYFRKKMVLAEWEVRKSRHYYQGIFQVLNMRPDLHCGRTKRSKPKVA